jgi:hypothetical protein
VITHVVCQLSQFIREVLGSDQERSRIHLLCVNGADSSRETVVNEEEVISCSGRTRIVNRPGLAIQSPFPAIDRSQSRFTQILPQEKQSKVDPKIKSWLLVIPEYDTWKDS